MYVKKIKLKNFRNYTEREFEFSNGVNIFYGDNGQGKTNVLEALFLSSIGKSFRTNKDIEMIKDGCDSYEVTVFTDAAAENEIKITYNKNKKKTISISGIYLTKMGDLMGILPGVIFSPQNMSLLSQGPGERRKFMDMAISQLKPVYYFNLQQYNKIINQKNAFLKEINPKNADYTLLDIWNEQLSKYGAKIVEARKEYFEKLTPLVSDFHSYISGGKEKVKIKYIYSCDSDKAVFYEKLEKEKTHEVERHMSLVGPQRDDIDVILEGTGDIKKYGSQGQQRTLVIAMKLSELTVLRDVTGKTPVLLLDDVLSELDDTRQKLLLGKITDSQVFITCTNPENIQNTSPAGEKSFFIKEENIIF